MEGARSNCQYILTKNIVYTTIFLWNHGDTKDTETTRSCALRVLRVSVVKYQTTALFSTLKKLFSVSWISTSMVYSMPRLGNFAFR